MIDTERVLLLISSTLFLSYISGKFYNVRGGSLGLSQLVTKYDPDLIFFLSSEVFTSLVVPIVLISLVFTSVVALGLAGQQIHSVVPFFNEGIDPEELEETEKPEKNGDKS